MKTQVFDFPLAASEAQAAYPGVDGWRTETRRGAVAICWPLPTAPDDAGNPSV